MTLQGLMSVADRVLRLATVSAASGLTLTGQIGARGWIGGAAVLGAAAGVGAAYTPPGFGAGKAS